VYRFFAPQGEKTIHFNEKVPLRQTHIRGWKQLFSVVTSYTLLTLPLFLPVLKHFTSAIIVGSASGEQDGWQNVWGLWWVQQALLHGRNPYTTTLLYYPTGVDLFWQTLNLPHGVMVLPITALINAIAAYNSLALLTFIASGCTMYLLAWRFTHNHIGAWIAGCLFAFSPFHITKLFDGQLELLCIQYVPLFVLCLWYAFERASWRASMLAGGLLIVMTLTSLYYGLFSIIYLGLYSVLTMASLRDWNAIKQRLVRGIGIVAPVALILVPRLIGGTVSASLDDWQQRQLIHSAHPLDIVLPSPYNAFWGASIADLQSALHPGVGGFVISSGVVTLVLAALSLIMCRRAVWRWAVLTSVILIFALGPYLVIQGDGATHFPLPFWFIDQLPGVKLGQRPNQIVVFSTALLALMAAFGWAALAQRLTSRQHWVVLGITLLCMSIDLWPVGLGHSDFTVSPFYASVPHAEHGAILELPYQPDNSAYMKAQLVHQRPLMGGYLARTPEYPFADEAEGIRQLWRPERPTESILYADWTTALTPTLATYDVEYIVVHLNARDRPSGGLRTILATQLEEVYRDETLIAYRRPVGAPIHPLLTLHGQGWYAVEQDTTHRWQWIDHQADLIITNPEETPRTAELRFSSAAFRTTRGTTLYQLKAGQYTPLGIFTVPAAPASREYRVLLVLPAGETLLRFITTSEQVSDGSNRKLGVVFSRLTIVPR